MHFLRISALVAALCGTLLPVSTHAQSGKASSSIEFSGLAWGALPFQKIFYRQSDKFLPLTLPTNQRSALYPLKGEEALQLYIPKEQPDGKAAYELVGQAAVPDGTKQVLFLIKPAQEGAKLPLRVYGIDDSLSAFPVGSFRFLNFTNLPLKVDFAGSVRDIPMGELSVVKPQIPELGGFLPFLIKDAGGNIGFQTRLFAQPRGREMVVIVPPTKETEKISVMFIPQIIPYPLVPESR
jgi:hypothetical protein